MRANGLQYLKITMENRTVEQLLRYRAELCSLKQHVLFSIRVPRENSHDSEYYGSKG